MTGNHINWSYDPDFYDVDRDDYDRSQAGGRIEFHTYVGKEERTCYFLSDPCDPTSKYLGYWVKFDAVDASAGINGVSAQMPFGCRLVPTMPPAMTRLETGKVRRVFQSDPILEAIRPHKFNIGSKSGRVSSSVYHITQFLDEDGNVRILELSDAKYTMLFDKMAREWQEEGRPFLVGQGLTISKSANGKALLIARKKGTPTLDPSDMPQPDDLRPHLAAIRETVDEFITLNRPDARQEESFQERSMSEMFAEEDDRGPAIDVQAFDTDNGLVEFSYTEHITSLGTTMLKGLLKRAGIDFPVTARRPSLVNLALENEEAVRPHVR